MDSGAFVSACPADYDEATRLKIAEAFAAEPWAVKLYRPNDLPVEDAFERVRELYPCSGVGHERQRRHGEPPAPNQINDVRVRRRGFN